jgi:nucleoside diphosphate-linked moiety X motif protein 19
MSAGVLKHWREAATMLVCHCRKRVKHVVSNELFAPAYMKPPKMPGAQKILVDLNKNWELDLLILRCLDTPNGTEFYSCPSGTIEEHDFCKDWLQVFGATNKDLSSSMFGFSKKIAKSAPMFHRTRDKAYDLVPPEIAFRICAIRETFIRTGVLIARSADISSYKYAAMPSLAYNFGNDHADQMALWREKCTEDCEGFLKMCRDVDIVPDVWSLFDWANWLCPADPLSTEQRYDNAFFVCCLLDKPFFAEDFDKKVRPAVSTLVIFILVHFVCSLVLF